MGGRSKGAEAGSSPYAPFATALALSGLAVLVVLTRLRVMLASGVVDADESVVFLMARRIASLRDLPVVHYGNAYLGSLDAFLAAVAMRIAGVGTVQGRLVPLLLSLLFAGTTYALARSVAGRRAGLVAAAYVAAGPGLLVVWGAKLHLGYLDSLVLGDLLALTLLRLTDGAPRTARAGARLAGLAGFICGLGLWCHILFLVFVVAGLTFMCLEGAFGRAGNRWMLSSRVWAASLAGSALGALPLLAYNVVHRGATLAMFERGLESGLPCFQRIASAAYDLVVAGGPVVLGAELPWRVHRAELPVLLPPGGAAALLWIGLAVILLAAALLARPRTRSRPSQARWRSFAAACGLLLGVGAAVLGVEELSHAAWPSPASPLDPRFPFATPALLREELIRPALMVYALWAVPLLALFWPSLRETSAASAPAGAARLSRDRETSTARLRRLLGCFLLVPLIFLLLTSYGMTRSPRFLFPLYVALPVVLAVGAAKLGRVVGWLGGAVVCAVLAINLLPQVEMRPALALQPAHYAGRLPVPRSYDALVACLRGLDVARVYSDYWTGFPLLFASGETILPSDGSRGRLPDVSAAVGRARRVAFVFYHGKLDDSQFVRIMHASGLAYDAGECGPFAIYSGLDVDALRRSSWWRDVLEVLSQP
jgi:hypothetical protein